MVEARLWTDDYERGESLSAGIPKEGVLIYEVQGTTEVFLRDVLAVGETFSDDDEDLTVRVVDDMPGGFRVAISTRKPIGERCAELNRQVDALRSSLEIETDMHRRKGLISALQRAPSDIRRLGCLPVLGGGDTFAPIDDN